MKKHTYLHEDGPRTKGGQVG